MMFGCSTTLQNAVFIKNKPQRLVPKGLATVRSTKPDAPKFGVSVRWRPTMSKEVPQQKTTARCSALRTTATKATVRLRGIAPSCQYTPKNSAEANLRHCFFSSRIVNELFYGSLFTVHFFSNCFISSCFSSFCISTLGLKRLASAPVFLSDASLNFSKLLSCKRCDMGSFTRKLSRLA